MANGGAECSPERTGNVVRLLLTTILIQHGFRIVCKLFRGVLFLFEFRHLPVYIVAFGTMKYHVISRPGHRSSSLSSRVQPFCFVFLFTALPLLLYKLAGPRRESNDDLRFVIVTYV